MYIFADEMAKQFTDTDEVLRMINLRLRKLEKSDSEKTEEIGRLNRIIGQKDKEIHSLKMDLASTRSELADAKAHIEELEENAGEHQSSDDDEDNSSGTSGKPEKNSIILPALQGNQKRTVVTAVSHHLRKVLRHVSCEGRSLCANPAESRVAVNLATREAP